MIQKVNDSIEQIINNFNMLKDYAKVIDEAAALIINTLKNGGKVIFCGNGGSAADSQHLAAELMGRYKFDRKPLPALSLTVDTSALTAIGNDYGYDDVFSRQLEGIGVKGDLLIGISTSGNSKNVIKAINTAKNKEIKVIAFTGQKGGEMKNIADICINVPSDITNNIQEMHIAVGHMLCGFVEEALFVKN